MTAVERTYQHYQQLSALASAVRRNEAYFGELENVKRQRDAAMRAWMQAKQEAGVE